MLYDVQFSVLVTDVSTRKSFDLVNILMHAKIDILLCDELNPVDARLLSGAYGKKIERLRKDAYFEEDLCHILEKYGERKIVYFPIEEDTTVLIYDFLQKHDFGNFCHNLPPRNSFDTVRDKGKFSHFCIHEGLPVPKEYTFSQLLGVKSLPGKLIIKPKSGSGSVGIRFIDTIEALKACADLDKEAYIIQERLENPTDVEGGFFLFDEGKICGYYGHKRLRTYPSSGGVSIYSKCDINPKLEKLGNRLLQKLGWSGIAMVEFLYDPRAKEYKIIEVNPRLWGSLMLAEFCGSEMLENYCLSALKLPLKDPHIQEDRYIRWFFPWDLLTYVQKGGKIENFWHFNKKQTCYINFTYSSFHRSFLFTLYNMINPHKLQRLFQKVFG